MSGRCGKVQHAPGGFGPDVGATKLEGLACEDTGELVPEALVLAIQVPNNLTVDADVSSGDVRACTDVAAELQHERLHAR